jgi:hypothetical protein
MSEINWDEPAQVQIFESIGLKDYQVVEETVIRWDEISLAEALRRCMRLSPKERAKISILTLNGYYNRAEIEALCHRSPE